MHDRYYELGRGGECNGKARYCSGNPFEYFPLYQHLDFVESNYAYNT